jgi:undecaprenyl-diphosphatase
LFSVFIQSGAILSVLLLFLKDLWQDKTLGLKVLVASVPTAIIGITLYDFIKEVLFESELFNILIFIAVGVVFIVTEKLIKKNSLKLTQTTHDISYTHALYIGCAQALAIIPGVSRAGAVIIIMMLMKYHRDDSARFSFMLSIPTIFAASALDLYESKDVAFASSANVGLLVVGFAVAFISSLIIVKWFIRYLQKHSLELFGWYRIIVGIALLLWLSL